MSEVDEELDVYDGTVLDQIVAIAGEEAAKKIVAAFGGRIVYFPRVLNAQHAIAQVVGIDAATKICAHFAIGDSGVRLLVPMGLLPAIEERFNAVKAFEAQGLTAPEMAARLKVHIRTIYRYRERIKLADHRARQQTSKHQEG